MDQQTKRPLDMARANRVAYVPHIGTYWLFDDDRLHPIYLDGDVNPKEYDTYQDIHGFSGVVVMSFEEWIELGHLAINGHAWAMDKDKSKYSYRENLQDYIRKTGDLNNLRRK